MVEGMRVSVMEKCPLIICLLVLFPIMVNAQEESDFSMSITSIMQYQRNKKMGKVSTTPFRQFGLKPINIHYAIDETDSCRMWGYHVAANLDFDKSTHKLYRIFKRKDTKSFAVIDYHGMKNDKTCLLVFWNKKYYRTIVNDLKKIGFVMELEKNHGNVLRFRKENISVLVDVVVWGDINLVEVK